MIIFVMMITYVIMITTVVVSVLAMENNMMKGKLMFNPYLINHNNEWYRFISNAFIHADWTHLAFNMFALYVFGRAVEEEYRFIFMNKGGLFYVLLYIGGMVLSSLYEYERNKNNIHYNALGASGAVSSVVFAYIIISPTQKLIFLFLPVPLPAYLFGILFLAIEYYMGKKGQTNIGHNAHFWGAVHGIIFTVLLKPSLITTFFQQIFL